MEAGCNVNRVQFFYWKMCDKDSLYLFPCEWEKLEIHDFIIVSVLLDFQSYYSKIKNKTTKPKNNKHDPFNSYVAN